MHVKRKEGDASAVKEGFQINAYHADNAFSHLVQKNGHTNTNIMSRKQHVH